MPIIQRTGSRRGGARYKIIRFRPNLRVRRFRRNQFEGPEIPSGAGLWAEPDDPRYDVPPPPVYRTAGPGRKRTTGRSLSAKAVAHMKKLSHKQQKAFLRLLQSKKAAAKPAPKKRAKPAAPKKRTKTTKKKATRKAATPTVKGMRNLSAAQKRAAKKNKGFAAMMRKRGYAVNRRRRVGRRYAMNKIPAGTRIEWVQPPKGDAYQTYHSNRRRRRRYSANKLTPGMKLSTDGTVYTWKGRKYRKGFQSYNRKATPAELKKLIAARKRNAAYYAARKAAMEVGTAVPAKKRGRGRPRSTLFGASKKAVQARIKRMEAQGKVAKPLTASMVARYKKATPAQQKKMARKWSASGYYYAPNKRRSHRRRHYAMNRRVALPIYRRRRHYAMNRRRHIRRHYAMNRRRYYRRNADFSAQLKTALKLGVLVTGGFAIHRLLSNLLNEYGLSKIGALSSGTIGNWRAVIAGAIVGGAGIFGAVKLIPGDAGTPVAAGMAGSLLVSLISRIAAEVSPKAGMYLSAYPDAGGRAYGSYYTTQPMRGYGEYIQTSGMMGMGQYQQAAAGVGRFQQAAAGYGQPMLQAAAGMGGPRIMQAAAGTGEYIAYGASGIGEYEEVPAAFSNTVVNEGIAPNLRAAEIALNHAEAAAGIGDVSFQNTVDPTVLTESVEDAPGGSRAGVFQGGDGIFG